VIKSSAKTIRIFLRTPSCPSARRRPQTADTGPRSTRLPVSDRPRPTGEGKKWMPETSRNIVIRNRSSLSHKILI
jgi:hypothetical protein